MLLCRQQQPFSTLRIESRVSTLILTQPSSKQPASPKKNYNPHQDITPDRNPPSVSSGTMTSSGGNKALTRHEHEKGWRPQLSPSNATFNTDLPPAVTHATFPLFDLPAELREMVYTSAITAGTMGLLRCSHAIHREASPLVRSAVILRIRVQACQMSYREEHTPAEWPSTMTIQNIEISVKIRAVQTDYEPEYSGVIDTFTSDAAVAAVVERDTCYIVLKKSILERLHTRIPSLFRTIRKLRGFKRIVVTAIATGVWDKDTRGVEAVIRARNKPVYKMALDELEPVFGPGIWHDAGTQESRYVEFRP